MYNKSQIKNFLEKDGSYIDDAFLSEFIKKNKIDAIYEDENGEEYFDEIALNKIKNNIPLTSVSSNNVVQIAQEVNPILQSRQENYEGAELKKLTLDITNQTLTVLAETIAGKITADVAEHIKKTDFFEPALETGALKRDNEILAKQVEKLLEENKRLITKVKDLEEENKRLITKVKDLEEENNKFKLITGTIYWKIS